MPIVLGAALLALWALSRKAQAPTEGPSPGYLAPAQGTPGMDAPDWAKLQYTQAMASQNPILIVATAQALIKSGDPKVVPLAQALSRWYQAQTNQPIPGVPAAAGAHGAYPNLAACGAFSDARVLEFLRSAALARRKLRAQSIDRAIRALQARSAV